MVDSILFLSEAHKVQQSAPPPKIIKSRSKFKMLKVHQYSTMAALAKVILSPALRGTHLHAVKHVRRVRYTPYPNATVVFKSLTI